MDSLDGDGAASHTNTIGEEDGRTSGGGSYLVDFTLVEQMGYQVFDEMTFPGSSRATDEEVVPLNKPVVRVTLFLGEFFHGMILVLR
jgi:hypothetical protein